MSLSMPEFPRPTSLNGRPTDTHDRQCHDTPEIAGLHLEHRDSQCLTCGCCWGCDSDCCSEYVCPNTDCGCNDKPLRAALPEGAEQ